MRAAISRRHGDDYRALYAKQGCVQDWQAGPVQGSRGEAELAHALDSGASIIGVNNRDLRTFEVDFETTARLRPLIPADKLLIAESGIRTTADVQRLAESGVDGMLVGERLVKGKGDVTARVRELVGAGRG